MSTATLTTQALPQYGPQARLLVLDCKHGTTRIWSVDGAAGPAMSPEIAARMALLRHQDEEGCRCTRHLWRRHFGTDWPTVPAGLSHPPEAN